MKTISFQKLTITNFKGIKALEIIFSHNTIIKGDNATGKSTVFDSILWSLFGKNSQNESDFSIKNTVDTELNRQDHVVELSMLIDGVPTTAKRVYKEVWQKRRGSEETVRTGHTTDYFWNNVPQSEKEYQAKVSEVCEEQLFKLLTNALYFNVNLSETKRRDTLVKMAGDIPDSQIIGVNPAYIELFAKIQGQKTIEDYKKEVSYSRLALKKQLVEIPPRIDELLKSTPKAENWQEIENEIAQKKLSINGIEEEISGANSGLEEQNKKVQEIQTKIFNAQREMRSIENRLKAEAESEATNKNSNIRQAQYDLANLRRSIQSLKADIRDRKESIETNTKKKAELLEKWHKENATTFIFDDSTRTCFVCKRDFEVSDIEESKDAQTKSFNAMRQIKLSAITAEGKNLAAKVTQQEGLLKEDEARLAELTTKETELLEISSRPLAQTKEVDLTANADYMVQKAISEQIAPVVEIPDTSDLKEMKQALQEGINSLLNTLSSREVIVRNTARIDELKANEKDYSRQIAELEKSEFTIENFQKDKMELVEKSINDKFKLVKFQLFRKLITTGAEEQCCITTLNDVPFSDLNHAGQLQAGIDIINALSKFYGVSAPCIIDNAESTNQYPEMDNQLIRLYVTLDKELTVVNQ